MGCSGPVLPLYPAKPISEILHDSCVIAYIAEYEQAPVILLNTHTNLIADGTQIRLGCLSIQNGAVTNGIIIAEHKVCCIIFPLINTWVAQLAQTFLTGHKLPLQDQNSR